MELPHVLLMTVAMVIGIQYTRSGGYGPETNITSIPPPLGPWDNHVAIFYNHIPRLPKDAFISYSNLEWIQLQHVGLRYIDEGAFRGQNKLSFLYINNGGVELQLPSNLDPLTQSLEKFLLWSALPRTKAIIYPYFAAFEKLKRLSIGSNFYATHLETFKIHLLPRNLTELKLFTAVLPTFPSIGMYAPSLQRVELERCEMNAIPVQNIYGLAEVKMLVLRNNALSIVPDISFMKDIEDLKLDHNRLASMPDLYELPLTILTLAENPLICDKALCWIRMWPWMKASAIPTDDPTCAGPAAMVGMKLMDVDPVVMECFRGQFPHNTHSLS